MSASYIMDITDIDKEVITKTEFQSIKEKLDHNYYKRSDNNKNSLYESSTYNDKLKALKDAVDELLILLDKAVS